MARKFAKSFYNSKQWKQVRAAAMIRDKGLCQIDDCYMPAQEVHHIVKLTESNINDSSVSLNLDNLMCLCRDCHMRIHNGDRYANDDSELLEAIKFDTNGDVIKG